MRIRCLAQLVWVGLVGMGLLVGGCNVYGPVASDASSVEALLSDARTALATGKPGRAVHLLERAFERDSSDVRVRVELANALYAERGLDVFVLRRAVDHLVERADSGAAVQRAGANTTTCSDGARPSDADARYVSVPVTVDPLERLRSYASVVERVRRLVVTGVLDTRSSSFSDAPVGLQRKGLLIASVTTLVEATADVQRVFSTTEGSLYWDREAGSLGALVACARSEDRLDRVQEALCTLGTASRTARQWLRMRNRLSGSEGASVLIGRLHVLSDAVTTRVECS